MELEIYWVPVYGLIGKASGELGNGVWIGFLIGAVAAGLTGLSYASLGSRYPKAGGCAYILHKAFGSPLLSYVIGFSVLFAGVTSMATSSRAFAGYLVPIAPFLTPSMAIGIFVTLIAGIVLIGLKESMILNIVCTVIEVSGLLIVIFAGLSFIGNVNYLDMQTATDPVPGIHWGRAFSGAIITFYSFIGFEDMLNVSEEVKKPNTTLPRALLLSVFISSCIYLVLSIAAVSVIPASVLTNSTQPLVEVVKVAAPWFPSKLFSIISLFALFNTALLAFITGSRLIYGMSKQQLLPAFLSWVTPKASSPYMSIFAMVVLFTLLVSSGDIKHLAMSTSATLLGSYTLMNIALIKLKHIDKHKGSFEIATVFPVLGAAVCIGMLLSITMNEVITVTALFTGAALLYFIMKPHHSKFHLMHRAHKIKDHTEQPLLT